MFNSFDQSEVDIVAPDGSVRQSTKAVIAPKKIVLPDPKAVVSVGDEIRRKIPNGTEEVYHVTSTMYFGGTNGIPAHHQVSVRQKGNFPQGTGGNYSIHITGANARVNVHSTDNSNNTVGSSPVFEEMLKAVGESAIGAEDKSALRRSISNMEARLNDRDGYRASYQDFITVAATHMTVIAPFLPALAKLLS